MQQREKSLIVGAMQVALYGLRQEELLASRHWGYENPKEFASFARVDAALEDLKHNKKHYTNDARILDLMAHTQQTLRVNHDDWEEVQMIFKKDDLS